MSSKVCAHVALYGLTTQTAVSRLFLEGNGSQAFELLHAMVAAGQLYRHGKLFTPHLRPPSPTECAQGYGVLWFTCLATPIRKLLTPEQVMRLARPLCEQFHITPPSKAWCYLDPASKKLVLLRVQPLPRRVGAAKLQRVLSQLQTLVNSEPFTLWSYLAMSHSLMLTFLMWDRDQARELSLWLRRRPLMSDLVTPPVEIPILVWKARRPP